MKNLFIPYELAVIAKEKGFKADFVMACFDSLNNNAFENTTAAHIMDNNYELRYITTPLYQQIVDWFREKHGIHIVLDMGVAEKYYYKIYNRKSAADPLESILYADYYEALNRSIERAFKLI